MLEKSFATMLAEGDMRTTGRASEVVNLIAQNPNRANELVDCLTHESPGVRMRATDALQKASTGNPALLMPFKEHILDIAETSTQQEVQWHCAEMLRVMDLSPEESERARATMLRYFKASKSAIVKADAIETLAVLALKNPQWTDSTRDLIQKAMNAGHGAVAARSRKALKLLEVSQ